MSSSHLELISKFCQLYLQFLFRFDHFLPYPNTANLYLTLIVSYLDYYSASGYSHLIL